jgi:biotin carboxyl carrier protein
VYSIVTAGRAYEARIHGQSVAIGGWTFSVEVLDPRRWDRNRNHRHAEGRQSVAASMPGKVVRVLIAEGDLVEPGQGLVVVEAMKMQNEMKAARAGKVVSLTAVAGATVSAGEVLVVIE